MSSVFFSGPELVTEAVHAIRTAGEREHEPSEQRASEWTPSVIPAATTELVAKTCQIASRELDVQMPDL